MSGPGALAATEACLAAIERHNGLINAMLTVDAPGAREAARAADRAALDGRWLGLLHGLPVAVKDNIDTAGLRTTSGSLFFQDNVPNQDATVVRRLRRAGAVLIGKANMQELAFGIRSTNPLAGPCRNPWDPDRVPGGSSGGSGAAVIADMCAAALGSDTGGSIRLPASMTGVAGLRPTHGRVPNTGSTPVSPAHDTIGPLARRVADVARLFAVIAGHDPADPVSAARPLENFLPSLDDGIAGVRIGLPRSFYFDDADAGVAELVMAAARVLEARGAELVDVDLAEAAEMQAWASVMIFADACAVNAERLDRGREWFDGQVYDRMITGRDYSAVDYSRALAAKASWKARLGRLFGDIDILLSPTVPSLVPPVEEDRSLLEATRDATRNTYCGAFGELPGLSLPCGFTADGLPAGLQLEAAWWREPLLLRAGVAYQAATDWHLARPPLD
ncbi:MAG: amidase [Alphaproteobacteria bacterium]|nr:amidase [Alphaproteobacteria bacterium]MDP6567962.1 amidase [Alphaproteobacteria bacterium]MDP6812372.1 amidase [Alphaproteobacteria bacterium]